MNWAWAWAIASVHAVLAHDSLNPWAWATASVHAVLAHDSLNPWAWATASVQPLLVDDLLAYDLRALWVIHVPALLVHDSYLRLASMAHQRSMLLMDRTGTEACRP